MVKEKIAAFHKTGTEMGLLGLGYRSVFEANFIRNLADVVSDDDWRAAVRRAMEYTLDVRRLENEMKG